MSLTSDQFSRFRRFLSQASGISLGDNKEYLVQSRLRQVMEEFAIDSFKDLFDRIEQDQSQLRDAVVDAMTTNETLWFRDQRPFEVTYEHLLPELDKTLGKRQLRIWSSACSSGQEPYSLSMLLADYLAEHRQAFADGQSILATDISTKMIEFAQQASYSTLALSRGLPNQQLEKYFTQMEDRAQVKDSVVERVRFMQLNLLNSFAHLGPFDIVFCRNVLIYFTPEVKRDIISRIRQVLAPNGYLVLGSAESIENLSKDYQMLNFNPGIIYQAV